MAILATVSFACYWDGVKEFCSTNEVWGDPAIAEPSCWYVLLKILAIRREIALRNSGQPVVVAWVYNGVSKHYQSRHDRLRSVKGLTIGIDVNKQEEKKDRENGRWRRRRSKEEEEDDLQCHFFLHFSFTLVESELDTSIPPHGCLST